VTKPLSAQKWQDRLKSLPPKCSPAEASRLFKANYNTVYAWMRKLGLECSDGRKQRKTGQTRGCLVPWNDVDWTRGDSDLAKEFGVTRQAVHSMRRRLALECRE
jgi:hypothetical protein